MAASTPRQGRLRDPHEGGIAIEVIADLPVLHDMDAGYSPQYVKLARILRDKIKADAYPHGARLSVGALAAEHHVSIRVAWHVLEMLAANRYVHQSGRFAPYTVT